MPKFTYRWTTPMDVVATVDVEEDGDYPVEEVAYDMAVDAAKQRLNEISLTLNGVAVHGDIDGMDPEEESVTE